MDKRVLLAAGFSILILVIWGSLFPTPERTSAPAEPVAVENLAEETSEPDAPEPSAEPEPAVDAERVTAASVQEVLIENDVYEVALTNEGGRALSWKLRQYKTVGGDPLQLLPGFSDGGSRTLAVRLEDPRLTRALNEALYEVEVTRVPDTSGRGPGERVTFDWSDGRGLTARKSITFHDDSYLVDVDLNVTDRGRRLPAAIEIGPGFGAQEPASSYYYEAWVHDASGRVQHVQKNKRKGYDPVPGSLTGDVLWAGLEDQYFTALLLPGESPARINLEPTALTRIPLPGEDEAGTTKTEMVVSVVSESGETGLFIGPKRYRLLEEQGAELQEVVWFFSNPLLAWISKRIYFGLLWLHDNTIANYGLAIIMATFLLRLVLFPLNQYSMVRMKKTQLEMSRLQPKIKAIRAKYKKQKDADSRNNMNQEMMELYRKEGVNPMGGITGCLPMLAQFPILIGFYGMLTVAVELRGAPFFGWIQDLSRADPLWITPLLMGVTMFVQQMMSMSKVKDPVQQQQQRFMMIMPVVFTVICIGLPAGLVLYWFVNNVLGIGQQWLVNRHTSRLELASAASRGKPSSSSKPRKEPPTQSKKSTKMAR